MICVTFIQMRVLFEHISPAGRFHASREHHTKQCSIKHTNTMYMVTGKYTQKVRQNKEWMLLIHI